MARLRLRHDPEARQQVDHHPLVLTEAQARQQAGNWQQAFAAQQPLQLEIGMGRGLFITQAAQMQPQLNFIGLELREETMLDALKRLEVAMPANLRLLHAPAQGLSEYFTPAEVATIYLLFSDPWPKKRHAKRRLTAPAFLAQYAQILAPQGRLVFKTDGADFYDWSCLELARAGWQSIEASRDWQLPADEPASEYELRYRKRGLPIYYACFSPPKQG